MIIRFIFYPYQLERLMGLMGIPHCVLGSTVGKERAYIYINVWIIWSMIRYCIPFSDLLVKTVEYFNSYMVFLMEPYFVMGTSEFIWLKGHFTELIKDHTHNFVYSTQCYMRSLLFVLLGGLCIKYGMFISSISSSWNNFSHRQ